MFRILLWKYNVILQTSRSSLRMEGAGVASPAGRSGGGGPEEPGPDLIRQNQDLRRRLDEESASYRRRLDTYRQAQQHQAALVSRLQAKVIVFSCYNSVISMLFLPCEVVLLKILYLLYRM